MITRTIRGIELVAISPSRYYWRADPRLEFRFDSRTWYIAIRDRRMTFPSLEKAVEFCRHYIVEAYA